MWESNQDRPKKNGINPLVFVVLVVLAALLAIGIGVFAANVKKQPAISQSTVTTNSDVATDEGFGDSIYYEGEEYQLNPNITTVLFLGIDQNEEDNTLLTGGGGRADAIVLLLINDEDESITVLQISRDSMVDVDFYTLQEEYDFTAELQLAMQYSASASMLRANWLMSNKISAILYGTDIDYTAALSMDGISLLIDALGGIEITVPADYTDINPVFVEGETILLDGELAYDYVHYRDIEDFGSNNGRMERQWQVILALSQKLSGSVNADTVEMLQNVASPYMESNLSAEVIEKLTTYTLQETTYTPEGENVEGTHDEFYIDDDALLALVIERFYQKVS